MSTDYILSKSTFIKGLQCDKHLYLYKYHKEWMDPLTSMQKSIFSRGTNIGKLAQQLFPGGKDASPSSLAKFNESIALTESLIAEGQNVIYEAAFVYNEVLAAADIVVNDGTSLKIYEVKSSTSVNEVYINDTSVQYWIISNLGYRIDDISIVHINNKYERKGDLDLNSQFKIESVLERVLEKQKFVGKEITRQKKILSKRVIPQVDIGMHCRDPYACEFIGHCWKHIPDRSIFNIAGMHLNKKFELYEQDILSIEDIPEDYPLSGSQQLQIDSAINHQSIIDKKEIKKFLSTLNYPMFFVDFEAFQPPVPLFNNSRPYQQIPFQYSLHYKENKEAELQHCEFIAESGSEPRVPFIEHLLKDLESPGDIIVYNKSYEISRLKEIARDFPEYHDDIYKVIERIKDLMIPFQNKYYYTPDMHGSFSIKYVLPALVPELSYEGMDIANGATAALSYESLPHLDDFIAIHEIKQQLLEYCKLDTLAMVKILEKLEEVCQ